MECSICNRLAAVRSGSEPLFIAELGETVAVLHEHQGYEGWSVLWLKDHAEHLSDLAVSRQVRIWEDAARLAASLKRAVMPTRINYACLGNAVAHVHWHLIPRHSTDPDPKGAVWARPAAELECGVDPKRRDDLIARIRETL
ncbi:MAG: HIT family protein [Phycisphaeraceae bacterium]|nr:HIT family protein [Phycisphaeraceae bacterium]